MSNLEVIKKQMELLNMVERLKKRREKIKQFLHIYKCRKKSQSR